MDALGREKVEEIIKSYRQVVRLDTEYFLHDLAIQMEDGDQSRTHLVMTPRYDAVLGFVSLGVKCLIMPEENKISKSFVRGMDVVLGQRSERI